VRVPDRPHNEHERLKALLDLAILDTAPEKAFDAIVQCVSAATGAPIALVSLVDETRQWFKARVGLDAHETPRELAFCAHAICTPDQPMIVPDSEADARFRDNPLVVGAPYVKSYLGAPLVDDAGRALGTLCAIDNAPRAWSAHDIRQVQSLAALVTELLRQRSVVLQTERLGEEVVALSDQLAKKTTLLEEVSQVANVGGWELDLALKSLTWTAQTRRIHEVDENYQPTLETAVEFYAPEAREAIKEALDEGVRTGRTWRLDLPLVTAKGRPIWVRAAGKTVFADGAPVRLIGAFQDITEERARQTELTEAVVRADRALADVSAYQAALDQHAIVAVTDRRGDILFVNDRFCHISGYPREELIGRNHRILNSGNHPRSFFVNLWRTIGKGASWHGEICNRAKDGRFYWVDTTIVPMVGADGRPDRFVSVRYDITARKEADAALATALKTAKAATEAKSAFLANMSHEIRTPLNGVIALGGALARTALSGRQREMVQLLQSSGETLERLLSDILDVSKIEAGKLDLHIQSFDLREAVESAAHVMRVRADDKGVGFDVVYGGAARGLFEGDVVRVRQIISNLTSNAVKFTDKGRVTVSVEVVDADDGSAQVSIAVEDTGIGFDEETGRRLFSRFEQADGSITRTFGGTGLGLSICRSLSEMMGGAISATSTPGVGSRFTVVLPLDRTMPLADYDRRTADSAPETDHDAVIAGGAALRILLAEDHPVNQRVVGLILEPYGVSLTMAANGVEALEAFAVGAFDVVLMDMQMPEMDGLSAARAIRALEKHEGRARTPMAMLSANAMPEHVDEAIAAGCDLHIAKPVTADGLVKGIEMALALGAPVSEIPCLEQSAA
jgi:PAS domain S-box-containing protein